MTEYVVPKCPNCGAPIQQLVNGACEFCATPLVPLDPTGQPDLSAMPQASTGTVVLTDNGKKKIQVIKVIRETLNLGLKEAKDLADAADRGPVVVAQGATREQAEGFAAALRNAGAQAEAR